MSQDLDEKLYVYPGTSVLRNRFGIRDAEVLDALERQLVMRRQSQRLPKGKFDLAHLQSLHRHLFQDIYPWAGEIRKVPFAKGGSQFMPPDRIEIGMGDVERRLEGKRFLRGLEAASFAREAGVIVGDINHVHPFREGNGRTELCYLKQLGEAAGHRFALDRIDAEAWMAASRASHHGDYEPMAKAIAALIVET